jgi:hypothetical protein
MAARRATEARQAARRAAAADAAGRLGVEQEGPLEEGLAERALALEEHELPPQPRSGLKRERCSELDGNERPALLRAAVLSPLQQQQERRRRLSAEPQLGPAPVQGWAPPGVSREGRDGAGEGDLQTGLESMSLQNSPVSDLPQDAPLQPSSRDQPPAALNSLRLRLQAALGGAATCAEEV